MQETLYNMLTMVRYERCLSQEYKGLSWEVSPLGAYLLRLSNDGVDLLAPTRVIQGNKRGGVFAAFPQFGPDERNGVKRLAQHGFGRTSEWRAGRVASANATMTLERLSGPYAGLFASVTYRFNRAPNSHTSFYAGLTLYNDSNKEMRIAPAFHPYIDISRLGEEQIEETQRGLQGSPTVPASSASLKVSDTEEVHIETRGFERMTWWTDALGKYVCIEPSLAGDSFSSEPNEPLEIEVLEPGDTREFDMNMTWRTIRNQAFLRNQRSLRR